MQSKTHVVFCTCTVIKRFHVHTLKTIARLEVFFPPQDVWKPDLLKKSQLKQSSIQYQSVKAKFLQKGRQ